ncbi:hypothetical protein EST38_g304 [Candolleomyces aberdarensis]|uniref:Protein arginine methyltransferase NDUFAF7 n=1 Tax=Candolleomyces aberdarensis TaxID=2316362 RepID=A0A4Q2E269_9AGAR|nr:hypothetical protein EST38_g304 [Candolleomyces aberdarensis]
MNPSHPVFGTSGDFITSPEISQVFGEVIDPSLCIWFVSQWANAGKPASVRLVELGPGRGTLMADILRTISKFGLSQSLTGVHFVETSQALRSVQERLQSSPHYGDVKLHWYNSITEIPRSPSEYTILVAHEFFDALPIHVLQKKETGWHEVLIANTEDLQTSPSPETKDADTNESTTQENSAMTPGPRLRRVLSPQPSAASMLLGHSSPRFDKLPVGSFIEVSPTSFRIAHHVGRLLAANPPPSDIPGRSRSLPQDETKEAEKEEVGVGGCGLFIDYGGANVFGDSFRAFKQHKIVDAFDQPGECDLTANVDFAYLKEAMSGLVSTHGPLTQSSFLERMGLPIRVDALLRGAKSEERRKVIQDAASRLVDLSGMGKEYKVLGITSTAGTDVEAYPFIREQEPVQEEPVKKQGQDESTEASSSSA